MLDHGLFVGMRPWLLADQLQLTHQAAHLETLYLLAVVLHYGRDAAAAGALRPWVDDSFSYSDSIEHYRVVVHPARSLAEAKHMGFVTNAP